MDKRHLQNRNVYQGCHYEQKFPVATMNVAPGYFHRKIEKIKPKEIPRHLIPRLLVVFTQQLEILLFILTNATNS